MDSTLDELRALIRDTFDIDATDLDPTKSIFDYGLDSLALTEFLFTAEEHFGIDLSDRDDSVTTLAGLAALIDRKRAAAPAASAQASASTGA
jgi:acyl carrier protein